jgi:hypothetical protein
MSPNDFKSLPELARHLMVFGRHRHYRTLAGAFQWTFTRAKLDAVIEKITRSQARPLAACRVKSVSLPDASTSLKV